MATEIRMQDRCEMAESTTMREQKIFLQRHHQDRGIVHTSQAAHRIAKWSALYGLESVQSSAC